MSVIAKIFTHNAIALFISLFSGVLFFFIPVIVVIANGYITGFVVIPHPSLIGLLIPHGVFELPAFALSCSYGIWLGLWQFNRDRINTLKLRLMQCIKVYFCVVVPLLIIAATIEGSLTKYMLKWLK
jgi:stage II sporulation protein M